MEREGGGWGWGRPRSQLAEGMGIRALSSRPGQASEHACPGLGSSSPTPQAPGAALGHVARGADR